MRPYTFFFSIKIGFALHCWRGTQNNISLFDTVIQGTVARDYCVIFRLSGFRSSCFESHHSEAFPKLNMKNYYVARDHLRRQKSLVPLKKSWFPWKTPWNDPSMWFALIKKIPTHVCYSRGRCINSLKNQQESERYIIHVSGTKNTNLPPLPYCPLVIQPFSNKKGLSLGQTHIYTGVGSRIFPSINQHVMYEVGTYTWH